MFTSLIVQIKLVRRVIRKYFICVVYIPHSSDKTQESGPSFCATFPVYIPHSSDKTNSLPHTVNILLTVYIPHSSDKTTAGGHRWGGPSRFTSLIVQIKLEEHGYQMPALVFVYIPHSSDKTDRYTEFIESLIEFTSLIVQIKRYIKLLLCKNELGLHPS